MKQPTIVALGFFDGVHLGHAALLRKARAQADVLGIPAVAMTFDIHPDELVRGKSVPLLYPREERQRLLKAHGMDDVVFLHFDRDMMQMPWERFLDDYLIGTLHAACLVCGYDYRFGYRGEGTAGKLAKACKDRGLGCKVIEKVEINGETVSSTHIRQLIADGKVAKARQCLGYAPSLHGEVIHGSGLGRTMGTPTANLQVSPEILLPKKGVYISLAHTLQGSFPAVTNIGCRPTVNGAGLSVEAWLLDYSGELYGKTVRLALYEFLRPEQRFDTLSELREEILHNAQQTRAYFSAHPDLEQEEQI